MKKFNNLSRFPEIEHVILTRADAEECFSKKHVEAEQVHQDKIVWVDQNTKNPVKGADGLITKEKDLWLSVHTADCLPILIYNPRQRIIAAVHAGWRSTAYKIIQEAVEEMKCDPYHLIVGIGPGICQKCFEVGPEVAQYFNEEVKEKISEDKWKIDLAEANKQQLIARGVLEKNIEVLKECTFEDEKSYFSFRRGDRDQRQGVFIKIR